MEHEHKIVTEEACCPAGTQDCLCRGMDSYVCTADDCPGIGNEVLELLLVSEDYDDN